MRRVVLRAPETDRKIVEIPTSVGDLDKTPMGKASYSGDGNSAIPSGMSAEIPCPTLSESVRMGSDGTGLVISEPGLYLVTYSLEWYTPLVGPMVGWVPPNPANRVVALNLNSTPVAYAQASSVVVGVDAGTYIVRCIAGDTLRVFAANNAPAPPPNTGTYIRAYVHAVMLAP